MFSDKSGIWALRCTAVALFLMLSSCSVFNSTTQNNKDESQQVEFLVLTSPSINPDVLDRASPIRLDVFQLTKKSNFIYTNYLDLIEENNDLNGDLLFRTQQMLVPDSVISIPLKVSQDIEYLGLTTGYRNIDDAAWKIALKKQPQKWGDSNNYLYLKVDESKVVQLSKEQMKAELKQYAKRHPKNKQVAKNGNFRKPSYDYNKGVFDAQ